MDQKSPVAVGVSVPTAADAATSSGTGVRDLPVVSGAGETSVRAELSSGAGDAAPQSRRPSWLDLSVAEQEAWLVAAGQPKFRRKQIEKWIYQQRADGFAQMTDLPQLLRELLERDYALFTGRVVRHQVSRDGTEKLLIEYPPVGRHGAGRIECVLIREKLRRTICVSSQVGCGMGCVFCASGLDGVDRSLTVAEILEQMLRVTALLPATERLSHIVMMGMGEPLANLANVIPALDVASSDLGLGISPRRITISTVGLPKSIDRLVEVGKRFQLAISLHAPTDELRNRIVPTNAKVGIESIMGAADRFKQETGRRLTFEYVLLGGLNDSPQDAADLADLLAGRDALINVIPYNPVAGLPYTTPSATALARFRKVLEDRGVVVKCRQRKGDDIDAACGQLRRSQSQLN
jgi:23S rRNA (adenine2503-C2)-methyltransferase